MDKKLETRGKKFIRRAAGETWEDETLGEWDPADYRIFCGDLGNEVTDEILSRAFNKYPSFVKAKVIREKGPKMGKTKGYGFVSFRDPEDFIKAMREMNGKYVGNRPIKLRKSSWKDRQIEIVKKKNKEKRKLGYRVWQFVQQCQEQRSHPAGNPVQQPHFTAIFSQIVILCQ